MNNDWTSVRKYDPKAFKELQERRLKTSYDNGAMLPPADEVTLRNVPKGGDQSFLGLAAAIIVQAILDYKTAEAAKSLDSEIILRIQKGDAPKDIVMRKNGRISKRRKERYELVTKSIGMGYKSPLDEVRKFFIGWHFAYLCEACGIDRAALLKHHRIIAF